jgi:hypothetical protein
MDKDAEGVRGWGDKWRRFWRIKRIEGSILDVHLWCLLAKM